MTKTAGFSVILGLVGFIGARTAGPLAGVPSFNMAPEYAGVGPVPSVVFGDFNQDGIQDLALGNSSGTDASILMGMGGGAFGPAVAVPAGDQPMFLATGDFNGDGLLDLVATNINTGLIQVILATGPGTFAAPVGYAAGTNPTSIAVSDLNGDGIPDLAVGGGNTGKLWVLLGTGAGAFLPGVSYTAGGTLNTVVATDFNGDGIKDLAVASYTQRKVFVLLGTGTGTFGTAVGYSTGLYYPVRMVTADFNGDGCMDLAVSSLMTGQGKVGIFLGRGDGTFGTQALYDIGGGSSPGGLAVGDFDGDGAPDLAVVARSWNNIEIFLGTGTGTFVHALVGSGVDNGSFSLAAGDLNGDGIQDLAVTNSPTGGVSILLGRGAGRFAAPEWYRTGTNPNSVAMGDFNTDGLADLAVANGGSNDVSVFLGAGAGAFGPATSYSVGTGPTCMVAADFNRDGIIDLAVGNRGSHDVSLLLGQGNGTFLLAGNYPAGQGPYSLVAGDFNEDGAPDLAIADYDALTDVSVPVLLGTGNGAFLPAQSYSAGYSPTAVALGDFNGDGHLDLATVNYSSVSILLGTGLGSFGAPASIALGYTTISMAVGDFNGDGLPDLAVTCPIASDPGVVSVLLGTGGGAFAPPVAYGVGVGPRAVAVSDFNKDGFPDLVVANSSSSANSVSVLASTGAGTFLATVNFTTGYTPYGVAAGDLNGDTLPDLAVADTGAYDVRILLNTTGGPGPNPKEASPAGTPLTAAKAAGTGVDVVFSPACGATDHVAYWGSGPIRGQLGWVNSACGLGISGSATFDPGTPPTGGFFYFVVVGQSATREGSYGQNSLGDERPAGVTGACNKPQDLSGTCP